MRDRIKEFRRVPARELLANQKNWRKHPERQLAALRAVTSEVGLASAVVAYETPHGLMLIDGHARVEAAEPDAVLPTLILDVDDSDADKLLAAMDTIADMAETDADALSDLLDSIQFVEADLRKMAAECAVAVDNLVEDIVEGEMEHELALRPHEHYDYLVVLARTRYEWNNLCDLLQIGQRVFDKGDGRTKIGLGRAIAGHTLIERLRCG